MQTWQGVKPAYNYLTGETGTAGQQYSYNRGNYTPTLQERRDQAYQTLMSQEKTTARDLVTSLQVLSPALVSLTDQAKGALGNKLKARQVRITSYNVCYTKLLRSDVTKSRAVVFS